MRVVLVSATPPPEGGIATWTLKYIEYCKQNNIEVRLVNTALLGGRGKQINTKKRLIDEIKRTKSVLSSMRFAVKISTANIVHINSSCSEYGIIRDYMCAVIAKRRKIPIVLHCHCNIEDQIKSNLGKIFLAKTADLSSIVLVLNKKSKEYITKLSDKKSEIIPNFVEKNIIKVKRNVRNEIREVVFVGHVQRSKGCLEIIEAARHVSQIHFSLVGPVSDEISCLNIPANVSLIGPVVSTDVRKYLDKADVFLFPSYTEGFSISLTEAMASGLPCIASDVGANQDMLENHGGILIKTKNIEDIVSALKLLADAEIRQKASDWNISKVEKSYLMETVMNQIIEIYKEVC